MPGRARDRRARARARRRRRLDRRLHQPGRDRRRAACSTPATAPSASATSRSASSAPLAHAARRRAGARRSSTRSASTTSPGCARSTSTATTSCPTCSPSTATSSRRSVDLPRALLERLGAIPSYYLRYFYFHDEVLEEQLVGKPRAAEVAEIERELLELYRDPTLTTKPTLLEQRGGAFYSEAATQLVASLATRTRATSRSSTCATTARSPASPTTTRSRCPARIDADGPAPLPQPPLAPELLGLVQHVAAYERLAAAGGDHRRPRPRLQGAARASAGRPGAAGRGADRAAARSRPRAPAAVRRAGAGRMSAPLVLAIDGGNSKTDLALVRADGEVLALVRGASELAAPPRPRRRAERPRRSAGPGAGRGGPRRTATARSPTSGSCCWPASTSPPRWRRCSAAAGARGLASGSSRSATTPSPSCAPAPSDGWGVARRLRRRDQLRRRRARRPARALPGARLDDRRLGRRLRRRPRRGLGRGPERGRARRRRRPSSTRSRRTSGSRRRSQLAEAIHAAASTSGG